MDTYLELVRINALDRASAAGMQADEAMNYAKSAVTLAQVRVARVATSADVALAGTTWGTEGGRHAR